MVTTTYPPHVSGVARSVETTATELRLRGVRCIVLAPSGGEVDCCNDHFVIRVPAVKVNGFYMTVRTRPTIRQVIRRLEPHIIHSHHPFLIGDAALLERGSRPLVYTYHTNYEHYVQRFVSSEQIEKLAIEKAVGYANHCQLVLAPSTDTLKKLRRDGVRVPIAVLPTGIDDSIFRLGQRKQPGEPRVVGFVSRLGPEKNLVGLARGLGRLEPGRYRVIVVGDGPSRESFLTDLRAAGLMVHYAGVLKGPVLAAAYRGMDVFVFASRAETQGMVVAEAALCGTPVVALDAPGVRDVVRGAVGRLVSAVEDLAPAIEATCRERRPPELVSGAVSGFTARECGRRLLELYLCTGHLTPPPPGGTL